MANSRIMLTCKHLRRKERGEMSERDEEPCESEHPCHDCPQAEYCDGWEATYCCTLCLYYNDEPDCENCDPMDI